MEYWPELVDIRTDGVVKHLQELDGEFRKLNMTIEDINIKWLWYDIKFLWINFKDAKST